MELQDDIMQGEAIEK